MHSITTTTPTPTTTTHGLSINIYGRGDASLGDGPSHMGIALYTQGSPTCELHHIRNPTDEDFIYDPRTQSLDDDPVLKGRCELVSALSDVQKTHAANLLSEFGNDTSNIPEFGTGNCQDWVAAAVNVLENAGVVGVGEGGFWKSMVNRSAEDMKDECCRTGRNWISGPESRFEGVPDARFGDTRNDSMRTVGKLGQNEAFRARIQSLLGSNGGTENTGYDEGPAGPFYVSSPFFSRMDTKRESYDRVPEPELSIDR